MSFTKRLVEHGAPASCRLSARILRARGVTLVEVMITVAIIGMLAGATILGMGFVGSSRLKRSSTMIAGAIRIAYAHANATSKPVRLVFDFENRLVILEEGSSQHLMVRGEKTGGAQAATETERLGQEEAEKILKGPRAPRAEFKPTKAYGFNPKDTD